MAEGPFRALVALDVRRFRGLVLRGVVFTGAALALFALGGHGDLETITAVLLGASVYYLLWPPMSAVTDRMEGGLELLTSLPVRPSVVARARMTGIALAVSPVAIHGVLAFVLHLGPVLGVRPDPVGASAVFVLGWGLSTGLGAVAAGVIIRWGVDAVGRWPSILFALGVILLLLVGERFEGALVAILSGLLAPGGGSRVVAAAALVAAVLANVTGYRFIRTGLERFRPERGRLRA